LNGGTRKRRRKSKNCKTSLAANSREQTRIDPFSGVLLIATIGDKICSRYTAAEPIPQASQTLCRDFSQPGCSALGTARWLGGRYAWPRELERRTS
jgi:hypothetical protein